MGGSLRPAPEQCGAFGVRTPRPGDCRAAGRHRLALGLARRTADALAGRRPARADHRPARIGFSPAGSVPKRWRRCGGSPPSCRSMPPLPWAEPFAGACLLRGFVGLFAVCYRFAAGRHALNRFCVAPDLCLICLVPTCLVPTCLVLNLLCVAPAFAEPPLCRSRFPRRGPCRMSQKK